MEIYPLGDSALILRLPGKGDPGPRMLTRVMDLLAKLKKARIPGVIEFVPAFASVAIFFDPSRIGSWAGLTSAVRAAAKSRRAARLSPPRKGAIELPVCYDPEFGLDLEEIARRAKVSVAQVVALHTGRTYRVHCLGFTPGFPYLSGLPKKLKTPRRANPRAEVPAGSVAIGGSQAGIYPLRSPGGWNVIGRTPVRLFDLMREPPALLRIGDQVRFRAIDRHEFETLLAASK